MSKSTTTPPDEPDTEATAEKLNDEFGDFVAENQNRDDVVGAVCRAIDNLTGGSADE